ncbi:MAG: LCP family protein [Patescibacteria group bacterium]
MQKSKIRNLNFFVIIVELCVLFTFFCSVTLVFAVGLFYHSWWYQFKNNAHITDRQFLSLIRSGLKTPVTETDQHKNILLLGVDVIANRVGDPVLTDTIMIFSLNTVSGELKAISLPRDLWSTEYQTKINALYEYGKQRYPQNPQQFPTEVLSNLIQLPIHNTIVLSLDQLSELIDDMNGVPITITESFTDEQFPRTDVDIRTEHDPKKLYERVEFVKGVETMNGERALQFVRSRHSTQLEQGTDDARTIRQQLLINAILLKLKDPTTLKNPVILGKLFNWYQVNFESELSVLELIQLGYSLQKNLINISLLPQTLSFETANQAGVITHPSEQKYNQWVYEVKEMPAFQAEVARKLGIK